MIFFCCCCPFPSPAFASFYSERYRAEVVFSSFVFFFYFFFYALYSTVRHPRPWQAAIVADGAAPDMMLRAAALLLGLVLSLRADFAPPTVNINLDDDPEVRWEPLSKAFNVEYLKKAAAEIIE